MILPKSEKKAEKPSKVPYHKKHYTNERDITKMKKKTKIIVAVFAILIIIGGVQSIINPTENNIPTHNPSLSANNDSTDLVSPAPTPSAEPEATLPVSEPEELQEDTENPAESKEEPFTEKFNTDIVITSKMILEQFIGNYEIPLATQLWTIAEFDEQGAIVALTNVTEKSTDISQKALVVFTPTMENDEYVGGTPHYVSVGDTIYGDDGYCDEFISNAEEVLKDIESNTP